MNVTHSQHESLSALLDAECNELELHRLLQQLAQDDALRDHWQRLNQVRAAGRPETVAWAACDVSVRVQQAIAGQVQETPGWQQRLWRPLAGLAVAATVAAVVVTSAGFLADRHSEPMMAAQQDDLPAASTGSPVIAPAVTGLHAVSSGARAVLPVQAGRQRMPSPEYWQSYLQRHADQAALGSDVMAWSPTVRVIVAESDR